MKKECGTKFNTGNGAGNLLGERDFNGLIVQFGKGSVSTEHYTGITYASSFNGKGQRNCDGLGCGDNIFTLSEHDASLALGLLTISNL